MLSNGRKIKALFRQYFWLAAIIGVSNLVLVLHYTVLTWMRQNPTEKPTLLQIPRARYAVNSWAKNIFFIDVFKSGGVLNATQACAVESAARANPEMTINVIFTSPVRNVSHSVLHKLEALSNVKFSSMNVKKFAKKNLIRVLRKVPKLINNVDLLRILLMLRFGGTFLDFDSLVVRPLGTLRNDWVVRVTNSELAAEIISISNGKLGSMVAITIMKNLMFEIKKIWEQGTPVDNWNLGRFVITESFKEFCSTSFVPAMNLQSCHGVEIYDKKYFPMTKGHIQAITHSYGIDLDHAYVLHLKEREELRVHKFFKIYYPQLVGNFCPISLSFFGVRSFI